MKKKALLILLAFFSLLNTLSAQSDKLEIAILDLNSGVGITQDQVMGLSDMLSEVLYNSGYFTIKERSQVHTVLQANNLLGKASLTTEQLQTVGKKLKVDAVVIGTINYIIRDVKLASDGITKINVGEYNVDIRLMSVTNGRMLSSAGDGGKGRSERELMKVVAQELVRNLDSSVKSDSETVQVLYDFLYVYPEDIGSFSVYPTTVINVINRNNSYGYNDWRLPTDEELSLMEANTSLLHLDKGMPYAHSSSWVRSSEKLQVRLVRSKVVVQQRPVNQLSAYFERTEHDFGRIPILSGVVTTKFCLQNPSSRDVAITNVTKTNSAISVYWDSYSISPGQKAFVTVKYDPNGHQGVTLNSAVKVQLSDGQNVTLTVRGKVE